MNRFRRLDIIEHHSHSHSPSPSFFMKESSLFAPPKSPFSPFFIEDEVDFALDFLTPSQCPSKSIHEIASSFEDFDTISDLIQIEKTPFSTTATRRVKHQRAGQLASDLYLQKLSDRVSALELGIDKLVSEKKPKIGERKYTWTTEIKSPEKDGLDRKYKWTAEVKDGKKKGSPIDKRYKFTAEIKGKGDDSPIKRTYQFEASNGNAGDISDSEKKEKKDKKEKKEKKKVPEKSVGSTRIVEITDAYDHGTLVLKQAFAKRVAKLKGKKKELSPQDAAMLIQMSFRAYLIKRSQALRGLRELAIAKNKLKELRTLFNNFAYRRRLSRDAEERQRFSEKVIVLLLTVDAIENVDVMVRAAKRSMVDELEAMLDVVDPQPSGGRSLSMRRRTFDMPDGVIQKELAAGVAQVVQMLDQEASGSESLEACL